MQTLSETLSFGYYTTNILLTIGFISALYAYSSREIAKPNNNTLTFTILLAILLIYRIGCQPFIWGAGSDREIYALGFLNTNTESSIIDTSSHDWVLSSINRLLYPFFSLDEYFVIIAFIYIGLYTFTIIRLSRNNSYWLLIAVAVSFSFTSYGYNTMRAGLALAFLLLGFSYVHKFKIMLLFIILGVCTHFSTIIPASAFIISRFWPKTKLYYILWFLSIPLSFIAGNLFNVLFSEMSSDHRVSYLVTTVSGYKIGFRFDFILYSLFPMAIGAYYIFKKKFNDKFYTTIYNTYILANIFWILVIRANYSDRFAYLSWFLMPFILVYPLLNKNVPVKQPNQWLALILLVECTFRFIT